MTRPSPTRRSRGAPLRLAAPCGIAVAALLAGCTTNVSDLMSADKVDYRSTSVAKTPGLEVPPDLTQLTRDSRYQQSQGGTISAAAYQAGTVAATTAPIAAVKPVAPTVLGDVRIERSGNERWLRTGQSPEQLWPQLEAFWKETGFVLTQDVPGAGVMETDWAENRAKLPQDIIRNTVGKVFDNAYSTGELDKFRTRVERVPGGGSEVYITHRGMQETYVGERKEETSWQPRPPDPQLEGELLAKLMQKLGATTEVAKAAVAETAVAPSAPAAKARLVPGQPAATLQVDDGFDRAWRRVGVALDRSGFTVEDRDRTQGVYFVRYVDPRQAGREEPNFFQRLFSFGKKDDIGGPAKYRVAVKSDGAQSNVTVLDNQGAPENGDAGRRITQMLLDELK